MTLLLGKVVHQTDDLQVVGAFLEFCFLFDLFFKEVHSELTFDEGDISSDKITIFGFINHDDSFRPKLHDLAAENWQKGEQEYAYFTNHQYLIILLSIATAPTTRLPLRCLFKSLRLTLRLHCSVLLQPIILLTQSSRYLTKCLINRLCCLGRRLIILHVFGGYQLLDSFKRHCPLFFQVRLISYFYENVYL